MEKFTPPKTLEEFKQRAATANVKSIPIVVQALERQREVKVGALDQEIKFHKEIETYLTDGILPERFH